MEGWVESRYSAEEAVHLKGNLQFCGRYIQIHFFQSVETSGVGEREKRPVRLVPMEELAMPLEAVQSRHLYCAVAVLRLFVALWLRTYIP